MSLIGSNFSTPRPAAHELDFAHVAAAAAHQVDFAHAAAAVAPQPSAVPSPSARKRANANTPRSRGRARLLPPRCEVLGRLIDSRGSAREVVSLPGAGGSRLVVDRLAFRGLDARLVAHLAADEPIGNARLAADLYLADSSRACRSLREEDLLQQPFEPEPGVPTCGQAAGYLLGGRDGSRYSIALVPARQGSEARWVRRSANGAVEQVVSVRDVTGELEHSSLVRAATLEAIARLRGQAGVSVATLGAELRRLDASPIVLNRALRSAVLAAVARREVSLSAIAMRCGRVKRDRRGRSSGETSWLARRVGLLAEGGSTAPTPWIHTDVLALIARRGLGIAPREVELG
ncbi:MAG: hypothetical protein ACR2ND_13290 [Solirubrobacteraceae bacterium]